MELYHWRTRNGRTHLWDIWIVATVVMTRTNWRSNELILMRMRLGIWMRVSMGWLGKLMMGWCGWLL